LVAGCASSHKGEKRDDDGPPAADPGNMPAGNPRAGKPQDGRPVPPAKTPGPVAEHPPDDQPGGNNNNGGNGVLNELHQQLSLRDKERIALGEHYFKVGKAAYDQLDYVEAQKNFEKAKEANPNDKKIQQYYLMAALLAGDRQAEFKAITDRLHDERGVSIDQQVVELKRLHDEGMKLIDAHEYDRAIVRFEQVLEKIRWFPYPVNDTGIEKSARENIIEAKRRKRERDVQDRVQREQAAFFRAQNEEDRLNQAKRDKIQKLINDGMEQLSLDKFEKAELIFAGVLEQDPGNERAEKFLEISQEGRHLKADIDANSRNVFEGDSEWDNMVEVSNTYVPDNKRTWQFPDKDYWTKVSRRDQGIAQRSTDEAQWIQDYRKKLATQKLTFNFTATPFNEVVEFLQSFTGLNITVSKAIDGDQVKLDLRLRDVIAQNALDIILQQTGFAISFKNETLMITPKEEAKGEYYLDIYDVQDILAAIADFPGPRIKLSAAKGGGGGGKGGGSGSFQFDDDGAEEAGSVIEPEKLEALIKKSTGDEEVWGEPSSYELHRGQIIVNQTKIVHENIRRVLKNLRVNVGLFVQVEARFILIHNDFLQDIGVDYRGLGNSDQGATPALPIWGSRAQLDPNIPTQFTNNDVGFLQKIRPGRLGPSFGGIPFLGSSALGGRVENILDGGDAYFSGDRLNSTSVSSTSPPKGLMYQATILDPFQINAIVRAMQERLKEKIVTAPVVVAANRQRVHISVVTQRAYISDYELASGGTGLAIAEVAQPIIATLQEGIVLDVRPTISADRKYVTLDLRPTLAGLQNLKAIPVNLGTVSAAAINVNIEVPEIKLQEAYTSVTVPDGGTCLVGGFRQFNEKQQRSGVPFVDNVPFLNVLFKREGELRETESLVILVTPRIVILRDEEKKRFNSDSK
jgi:type II secretory pathway component GspD/PulD (secretin)